MKNIEIRTKKGGAVVAAFIVGKLAVHKEIMPAHLADSALWCVSHIPTGMQISICDKAYWKGCPIKADRKESKRLALELAKKLQHLDWNFDERSKTPAETKAKAWEIIKGCR